MVTRRGAPVPLVVTKRLVAHLPAVDQDDSDPTPTVFDGDPVDLPAPCVRVHAGYRCGCAAWFIGGPHLDVVARARVVAAGGRPASRFVDDREGGYEAVVPTPSDHDRRLLQEQIEGFPVGTVVERVGVGIAVAFEDRLPPEPAPWGTCTGGRIAWDDSETPF